MHSVRVPELTTVVWAPPPPPLEEVWLARGLNKRWRVLSVRRTYGEFDDYLDASKFLTLLVLGDDHFTVLA